jgi:hypothetical protein
MQNTKPVVVATMLWFVPRAMSLFKVRKKERKNKKERRKRK